VTGIGYGHGKLEQCQTAYTSKVDSGDPLTAPTCTVQKGGYFRIQGTTDNVAAVEGVYYYSADLTSEAVSTVTHDKWRLRYRTSVDTGGLGARVVLEFTDASTETIFGATLQYSETWKTVSGTITADKTLKYIRFYAYEESAVNTNGTYYVDYDFLLLHTGTFTFPVTIRSQLTLPTRYVDKVIPKRVGGITDELGSELAKIHLEGEMELGSGWGSPAGQFMMWISHESHSESWQWFSSTRANFKVTTRDLVFTEAEGKVSFVWDLVEYRETDAADETYLERFGLG